MLPSTLCCLRCFTQITTMNVPLTARINWAPYQLPGDAHPTKTRRKLWLPHARVQREVYVLHHVDGDSGSKNVIQCCRRFPATPSTGWSDGDGWGQLTLLLRTSEHSISSKPKHSLCTILFNTKNRVLRMEHGIEIAIPSILHRNMC